MVLTYSGAWSLLTVLWVPVLDFILVLLRGTCSTLSYEISAVVPLHVVSAQICKRLRSPGIDCKPASLCSLAPGGPVR
jgi:hypothetical protein